MEEEIKIEGNSDINEALKEFELKSQVEQMQKTPDIIKGKEVEGVKFEVPSYGAVKYYNETATPKMVQMVMKLSGGAIEEQRQAEYVLLAFVIVAIGISLFLVFGGGTQSKSQKPPTEMLEQMKLIPLNM